MTEGFSAFAIICSITLGSVMMFTILGLFQNQHAPCRQLQHGNQCCMPSYGDDHALKPVVWDKILAK